MTNTELSPDPTVYLTDFDVRLVRTMPVMLSVAALMSPAGTHTAAMNIDEMRIELSGILMRLTDVPRCDGADARILAAPSSDLQIRTAARRGSIRSPCARVGSLFSWRSAQTAFRRPSAERRTTNPNKSPREG